MGDIAVENPSNHVPPHKKAAPSNIPNIDHFEGVSTEGGDDYANLKKLQRQLEYGTASRLLRFPGPIADDDVPDTSTCKRSTSRMSRGV
jgi:hypothetical protein